MASVQPERPVNRRSPARAIAAGKPDARLPSAARARPAAGQGPGPGSGSRASAFDRGILRARLYAGLAALGQEELLADRLLDYLALLIKWNGVYNLTAVRDPEQMLTQHLLDSLSIAGPLADRLPRRDGHPVGRVVDVGSGAGLPGIVLALAWPRAEVLLVEPIGKKAAFLRQCQAELALANLTVAATRVEALGDVQRIPAPDLIVCRAFASLADFIAAIERLAGPGTVVAAMKGVLPTEEIASLPSGWAVSETLRLQVPDLGASRHLVFLQRSGQEPPVRNDAPGPSSVSQATAGQ